MLERLTEVLPQKRGRLMRLAEWFSPAQELQPLPENPRAVRPIPPYDRKPVTGYRLPVTGEHTNHAWLFSTGPRTGKGVNSRRTIVIRSASSRSRSRKSNPL